MAELSKELFSFLTNLSQNNSREWFNAHKPEFENLKKEFESWTNELLEVIVPQENWLPTTAKDCMFRIYRDVRFSKDKNPYKTWLSVAFGNGGKNSGKIDYYLHLQPNESFLGAGAYQPTSRQMTLFRQEIDYNPHELKAIIEADEFKNTFPEIYGEKLKKIPKGYATDHPEAKWLLYKQLFFMHKYSNEEVCSPNFSTNVLQHIAVIRPFVHYLNTLFAEINP